ncbi:MAG: excinuclease ABC subunit UvrA [Anaerolineales bacterium]
MRKTIKITGASENNLKNIDVEIQRDALTVITGVSGSGKTSLAFDILYSEGQRRLLDSLSTFSRKYIPQPRKAQVESIEGLSPVIAIMQQRTAYNPRSTVGTTTDVYDYLRLLFTVLGRGNCPYCDHTFPSKTIEQITDRIQNLPPGTKLEIRTPVNKIYGENYDYLFTELRTQGYKKIIIEGQRYDTSSELPLDETKDYLIEVVLDRLVVREDIREQIEAIAQAAMRVGDGFMRIELENPSLSAEEIDAFYRDFTCPEHHVGLQALEPFYFSFNDPDSSCRTCRGLGKMFRAEPRLIVKNPEKNLRNGALVENYLVLNDKHPYRYTILYSLAQHYGFSLDTPYKELPEEVKQVLFYGTKGEKFKLVHPPDAERESRQVGQEVIYEGMVNRIDRWYKRRHEQGNTVSNDYHVVRKLMVEMDCPDCGSSRYKKQRLWVTLGGENINTLATMPINKLLKFLSDLPIPPDKKVVGESVLKEVTIRLEMLKNIGVEYLSLDRNVNSLSGGETQRVQLTTQVGSGLMGMMYILDEPSIGLHPRDSYLIIDTLKRLRDIGNTVIVIEHDLDTIKASDQIIEMGPGPGILGGTIVAQGNRLEVEQSAESLTGQFLSGARRIDIPVSRRSPNGKYISIEGARQHNLKNINVDFPLGVLTCVTGVSGSGKSSLVHDILYRTLHSQLHDPRIVPGKVDKVKHVDLVDSIINIDQSTIGRTVTSNPATYIGIFNLIRKLFAGEQTSKKRKYTQGTFSYNSPSGGGRCEECKGRGIIVTPLQFMPDVETICPVCKGRRYRKEILDVSWRGLNIADVLDLTFQEAEEIFEDQPAILRKLDVLNQLGLGYLKLGQSVTTLSGGEAQRIKLVKELAKIKHGNKVYLLDEPTTGLHLADIQRLLDCLNILVDAGNTVIVIEHNLEVIKTADWVIDLGPEGGDEGGYLVAEGTPEEVAIVEESYTGQFLKKCLTKVKIGKLHK